MRIITAQTSPVAALSGSQKKKKKIKSQYTRDEAVEQKSVKSGESGNEGTLGHACSVSNTAKQGGASKKENYIYEKLYEAEETEEKRKQEQKGERQICHKK